MVLKETNAPHVIAISALKGTGCEKLGKILLRVRGWLNYLFKINPVT